MLRTATISLRDGLDLDVTFTYDRADHYFPEEIRVLEVAGFKHLNQRNLDRIAGRIFYELF